MIVKKEYDLSEFEPWSGAVDTWNRLYDLDKIESFRNLLEEMYERAEIEETELNDLLWFESDWIYEQLGIRTESQIQEEIDSKQEELDDLLAEWAEIVQDESYSEEEKQEIWDNDYSDTVSDLKEEIKELEEELSEI